MVVAQSGGPSPVINCSLRGVAETCRALPEHFGRVFAGYHGIEGYCAKSCSTFPFRTKEISLLA